MLHKHRKLYLLLHERHHVQDVMHAHVTNQLSMGERVTLVLAANQALKILFRLVCLQAHVQISALFLSSIQCKYCSYFFQSVTVVFFIANFNIICFEWRCARTHTHRGAVIKKIVKLLWDLFSVCQPPAVPRCVCSCVHLAAGRQPQRLRLSLGSAARGARRHDGRSSRALRPSHARHPPLPALLYLSGQSPRMARGRH